MGVWGEITVRAGCANKRGIYKLGLDYLRKFDVWGEIMRSAQIAQIRGGFINWDWGFAKV